MSKKWFHYQSVLSLQMPYCIKEFIPNYFYHLLSKNGRRYLLYPFIIFCIVGGRISPFPSAREKFANLTQKKKGKVIHGLLTARHAYNTEVVSFLYSILATTEKHPPENNR